MKKMNLTLFLALPLFLAACMPDRAAHETKDNAELPAYVFSPISYEEIAPHEGIFGEKGIRQKKYFSSSVFRNVETNEKIMMGVESGSEMLFRGPSVMKSTLAPGRYELVSFSLGSMQVNYNEEKCGRISFSVKAGDVVMLKGPRPLATHDGPFGKSAIYVEFTNLPASYVNQIKLYEEYHRSPRSVDNTLDTSHVKVISPRSDNQAAFQTCVKEASSESRLLMSDDGAKSVERK